MKTPMFAQGVSQPCATWPCTGPISVRRPYPWRIAILLLLPIHSLQVGYNQRPTRRAHDASDLYNLIAKET